VRVKPVIKLTNSSRLEWSMRTVQLKHTKKISKDTHREAARSSFSGYKKFGHDRRVQQRRKHTSIYRNTYARRGIQPLAWHTERLNTNFRHVALTLCAVCSAVAHSGAIHGFFHVWRIAAVVVVACTRRTGPGSLCQAFIDVSSVECTGEGALCAS
jgi:hypothetical protein